ncbi:glycosyltransferase family 4 protein [Pleurocapsales cyanobacterium LEGE 10410]|nr:glycosyltransferase family 4 protein [Pleurocapsales cyanobacterium LEGE 10410]
MNILFIVTRADTIGGVQVHIQDLAIALQQNNHKVLVLTGQQGRYNEELTRAGIESVACKYIKKQINPFLDGKSLRYILYILDLFKPDLITAHSSKTGLLGRIASQITKIPCVFTAHGWSFTAGIPEPNRTIYRWLEKATAPLADKIICVSQYDRTIGLAAGIGSQQLLTIYNGMKDIAPSLRANTVPSEPIKIVMVARFDRQKDHLTLINAFQTIDAELILVGDGSSMETIRQRVEQLGIDGKVKFLGFRQDVAQILAQVQIFTLISHWEGLPYTIIEAMRAGLPVVASDVGGVKEIVIDGETGYIIPRGDGETLRQKLNYLIDREGVRSNMGALGRQKYESQLTFKQMYDQTLTAYQEAIKARNSAR